MKNPARIAIVGLGDLGSRICLALAATRAVELTLIGRQQAAGEQLAAMVCACSEIQARFAYADVEHSDALAEFFSRIEPDVIVHCASRISPWLLAQRNDPDARWLRQAGFAIQLPAQLPPLMAVMRAVRSSGYAGPVVNCSYPDVTHPMLRSLDIAPTVGIGNAGMILGLIQAVRRTAADCRRVRLFAHHSHVGAVVCGLADGDSQPPPRIFLDETEVPIDELLHDYVRLPFCRDLNTLTAAHAVKLITALCDESTPLYTSAPGPLGLPGGWPVRIHGTTVALDLPAALTVEEGIEFNSRAARADGIERIDEDGTVHFTEAAIAVTPRWARPLIEPLHPEAAADRFTLLSRLT